MKRAILSDIHGNLEALQAVLEDIRCQQANQIYCLGDIVGYGPNPCECLDLMMMQADSCVLGNHDQGVLFDPEGFSPSAERAIQWTRRQLQTQGTDQQREARWRFLCELPRYRQESGIAYVHGSVRDPVSEYVFPEDIFNERKLQRIFALVDRCVFQGHTHVPGIFTVDYQYYAPVDIDYRYILTDAKVMINVGSVGQPRDGRPEACYVLFDPPAVVFRRVAYPVEETAQKIYATGELDKGLGDRLGEGW